MITIDLPISFLAGAGFALNTRNNDFDRSASRGLLYQGFFLTPTITYFMTRFSDWEWHYLFDTQTFFFSVDGSWWGKLVFCLVLALTFLFHYAGFSVTKNLLQKGKKNVAIRLSLFMLFLVIACVGYFFNEATHVGSYALFHAGSAPPAWEVKEYLLTLAIAGLAVIPPGVIMSRRYAR